MNVFPVVSFSMMGLTIYGFGLALAVGFLLMWLLLWSTAPKAGMPRAAAHDVMLFALPLSFVIGRLVFCLFRREAVFFDMVDGHFLGLVPLLKVWEGGFSLPGLLVGLLIAPRLAANTRGLDRRDTADWAAGPAALVMACAHFGTYLAGEGYGAILEGPAFYAVGNAYEEWYVAVFALEGLVYLILAAVLLSHRRPAFSGGKALALIVVYGAAQLFLESLHRDNYLRLELNGFIRVNQLLCLLLAIYGLARLGGQLKERRLLHGALLAAACLCVIGAEFYEKLPLPTLVLYGLSAISCLALALQAGRDALAPRA